MLERWMSEGLITAEQAHAIRAKEDARGRGVAVPAEVLAYVGAILALSAVVFIASQVWAGLSIAEQVGLVALATSALWAGGWWVRGDRDPVRRRLTAVLWFLSAGGIGWLADLVATDVLDIDDGYALVIGLAVVLYAGVLYLYRRTSLQQIAVAGGVAFLCGGLSDIAGGDDWFGFLLWATGALWVLFTFVGSLTPRRTGFAIGAVGALAGSQAAVIEFFERPEEWGLALGSISAAALVFLSVLSGELVLLGFGIGGLFIFLVQVLDEHLANGLGGPLALFVGGLALVGVALVAVRRRGRTND
jgi:hypothetical protein